MRNFLSILFIILTCAFYLYEGKNNYPNSDERSSILIASGKYQSLTDSLGDFVSPEVYEQRLEFKKYPISNIKLGAVLPSVMNDDTNGFLYYLLLAGIMKFIGQKIILLRVFSVLCAAVNLYLIYFITGKFKDNISTQWIALILTAINPVFFEDAILIRSYMLMLTGILLSILFLLRIMDTERPIASKDLSFFFLSVLLAAGSHYLCFPLLLAEFCFIIYKYKNTTKLLIRFGVGYLFLLAIAIGWAYVSYPLGWKNLGGLHEAVLKLSKQSPNYIFSVKNLVREWGNAFTYFVGFETESFGRSRVILKISAFLFLTCMFIKFFSLNHSVNSKMLKFVVILSMFIMTIQSVFTHYLFNFLPHYLIYLVPFFIWVIAISITELSFSRFVNLYNSSSK
jgi:hypothetical protein